MSMKAIIVFSALEAKREQRRYPRTVVRHVFEGLRMECIWL